MCDKECICKFCKVSRKSCGTCTAKAIHACREDGVKSCKKFNPTLWTRFRAWRIKNLMA
jgi:hypothetical protein